MISVLVYRHRHGEDVSAYVTPERALIAAAQICMEYAHELRGDSGARVRELFAAGQHQECVDLYIEACADQGSPEDLEIYTLEVQP